MINNREKILIGITFILAIFHIYYEVVFIGTMSVMAIAIIVCLAAKTN